MALGLDPVGKLLDLVPVEQPTGTQTGDRVSTARRLLTVVREHSGGDPEQPGPVRSSSGVKPGEAVHRSYERLRGQIGNGLRITAPAREVAHQDVDVAPVRLLELVQRRPRRLPRRRCCHRDRSLPRCPLQCCWLSAHVFQL